MDPSSSKKCGVSKQSGSASKKNAFFSRTGPHPRYFPHFTSPLAAPSQFASNGFPPFADHNTASSSSWNINMQPSPFNYLTSNVLPPLPDEARKVQRSSLFTLLTCNGLNTDDASSSAQQKHPCPSQFSFTPNSLAAVQHNASPSGSPKEQPSFFSFFSQPLSYDKKFLSKAREPPMLEFLPPVPSFDPDARYDLSKPILPDVCVRCKQGFNFNGKDGGMFMYNDKAYCSLKCRQKQIDMDNPPEREDPAPPPVVIMADGKKKRKITAEPPQDHCTFSLN